MVTRFIGCLWTIELAGLLASQGLGAVRTNVSFDAILRGLPGRRLRFREIGEECAPV